MSNRVIPKFATEAEEADWWYEHREETAQDFVDASQAGMLGAGFLTRMEGLRAKRAQVPEPETVQVGNE